MDLTGDTGDTGDTGGSEDNQDNRTSMTSPTHEPLNPMNPLNRAFPLLLLSGALAAINGANVRVVMLDLNSPEARGGAIALLNFINCFGRGLGPSCLEAYMHYTHSNTHSNTHSMHSTHSLHSMHSSPGMEGAIRMHMRSRRESIGDMLLLWIVAGALLCMASTTIVQDEVGVTIIDTIIQTNYTNDAYIFDTYDRSSCK
jgi:hypothetical protein